METRKSLFRKVERAIEAIERSPDVASTITQTASAVIENFREDLGVRGGRLYERRDGGYELTRTFGDVRSVDLGLFVPDAYPPVQRVIDEGVVVMDLTAPGVDQEFEKRLDADRFAAIAVGDDEYILAFTVDPTAPDDDLMSSLGIMRLAVDQKLRQNRFVSALNEARQIQMSILPKRSVRRGAIEVAGYTAPAEIVGGDYFDFIPLSDRILGVAIADASGHGLPAALQVRDVYTGLRMGVERDFKIVRTVERLNRIINQSRMTTRFVSLFYGEVEEEGNFMYVNAGHPPPLHFHSRGVTMLKQTGMVLGPSSTATYSRGFRLLERGDALLMYTDGMFEAHGDGGNEYGLSRLTDAFLEIRDKPADEIARRLIEQVQAFAGGGEPEDDQTVVVIKRGEDPPVVPVEGNRLTGGSPRQTG
ncbi:MAG: PP2C family protein-serine/threonine phosphatase [Acidobacteria bacterium]|nr:PP2C family protein-serine/threonine phosphatase [Acidobacteriota bacterium]MCA1609746.1 PP2C family protein-serine/threonine phosphatase [Acidobacteriota bacterium]